VNRPDAIPELTCDEVRDLAGAYVLGALEAADEAAIRAHLATCDQAHPEIAELGGVIPALGELVPIVEPPEGLKARIMAAAAADLAARSRTGGAGQVTSGASAAAAPIDFAGSAERAPRRVGTSTAGWLLRIAAVFAIVALGGWNVLLQADLSAARRYEQDIAFVLERAAQPGARTAILTADGGTGSGLAAVDANGNVALAMRDLVPTSGNGVYQAWAIGGDGVPVPLGGFRVGSTGTAYFESAGLPADDGIVLALTSEPGPGATSPTLPIISKGVTTSPG
jgi:anti-sigma-K factor RskA